jgi:hypothetical protein
VANYSGIHFQIPSQSAPPGNRTPDPLIKSL